MKKILFIPLFLLHYLLPAQVAELTLIDALTKRPIPNAEVYYSTSLNGTITNEEGKAKITIEPDTLTLSHIGYMSKKILTINTFTSTTLYLNPQEIQLEEVVLYNYDLKKKIKYVLENYHKLYDTKAKILECTYREKTTKNGKLIRLYQNQLNWWSKDYVFRFKEPLNKFIQIELKNTDYAKIIGKEEDISNELALEQKTLMMYLHLSPYLVILNNAQTIDIKKVEKDNQYTIVTFDAYIEKVDLKVFDSVIYFDNHSGAIKKIIFNQLLSETVENVSRKSNIPYKSTTEFATWELTFTPYNNKMLFSSFAVKAKFNVEIEGKTYTIISEENFLRTGTQNKHIKKENRINIENPFFEYTPPHKQGEAKYILTTEEEEFIKQ